MIQEETARAVAASMQQLRQQLDENFATALETMRKDSGERIEKAIASSVGAAMKNAVIPHVQSVVGEMKTQIQKGIGAVSGTGGLAAMNQHIAQLEEDVGYLKQLMERNVPQLQQSALTESEVDAMVESQDINRLLNELCASENHHLVIYAMEQIQNSGYEWMDTNPFLIVSVANVVRVVGERVRRSWRWI